MSVRNVKEKKVLHVIHGFGTGGAETWLLSTIRYLKSHPDIGLRFDFLATGGKPEVFDEEVKSLGSKIFYLRYSISNFLRFGQALRNLLQTEKYDAIHDHQDFISGWHYLSALPALPPIRISHLHNPYNFVHNYVVNPGRWISYRVGRLLTVALTSKMTATSDAVMDEYGYQRWPFNVKRTYPAYCGFDESSFSFDEEAKSRLCEELDWPLEVKVALFVGRIDLHEFDTTPNQKNPSFAFTISKKLVSEDRGWKFLFVGYKGSLGETMEAEVINSGWGNEIKFLGLRKDVASLMSASDVLIFPSLWEGLGMVAVEAQAAGLPVIMSDAVPQEAVVCKDIVSIQPLSSGVDTWIQQVKDFVRNKRCRNDYASVVAKSSFSIANSVRKLAELYA